MEVKEEIADWSRGRWRIKWSWRKLEARRRRTNRPPLHSATIDRMMPEARQVGAKLDFAAEKIKIVYPRNSIKFLKYNM